MRYVLAIAALVISGVLLILGVGQRTFLAGPSEITFPVEQASETGYGVIDGKEFSRLEGQANVLVQGSDAFVATGATRDVQGWLAPFPHAEITVDEDNERMRTAAVASSTAAENVPQMRPVDPRGSDLWLESRSIENQGSNTETATLRVPVAITDEQSVLIASNGADPLPSDISVVWVQDRATPWAGPLLAAGGLFALIGLILYLLAVDHDRRGLGPRRGRRGPLQGIRNLFSRQKVKSPKNVNTRPEEAAQTMTSFTRSKTVAFRRASLPTLGLVALLGLSGCSASYWPDFSQETKETSTSQEDSTVLPPVPVTDAQMDRIVDDVARVASLGDDSLDAAELESRFSGDALLQRSANYTIRQAVTDYGVLPPRITSERLDYKLVQSTDSWPRTMFVTVASEAQSSAQDEVDETGGEADKPAASPSLAMILTQQTPQENYLVSRVIALQGGIAMPQAAPAEEGTALLANDLQTLVLPPGEVGTAFAAVLQGGTDVPEAELFNLETDTLLANYGLARAQNAQKESDDKGQTMKFSAQARQGDQTPVALSTGVGGALVATTVMDEQIVDAAGGRFKPQAAKAVTALSGLTGEQDRVVQEVAHQMLFFVPNKDSNLQIELLGVTSELVKAGK